MTVGRVSVDLYADEAGAGFGGPQRFVKSIGGTATNVAVAAARLGHRAAVLTKVGDDPFGGYVRAKLAELGVDTRFVGTDHVLRTPLAFAALTPPEDPELLFYREPAAPDMQLVPDDVDAATVRDVAVLWIAGSSMAEEPARSTVARPAGARRRAEHTVLDLDYRAMLWDDPDDARRLIGGAVDSATVAIGNRAECDIAVGTSRSRRSRTAPAGARRGASAVVKLGGDGVLVRRPPTARRSSRRDPSRSCAVSAPATPSAGRSSTGSCSGWPAERTVAYANAAGAIVASRLMCADAMPTADEIDLEVAR